jgi:hypothetical protein
MPKGGAGGVHLLGGERQGIKHEEGERPAEEEEERPLHAGVGEGLHRQKGLPRPWAGHRPQSTLILGGARFAYGLGNKSSGLRQ